MSLFPTTFLARYGTNTISTTLEWSCMPQSKIKIALALSHCCLAICLAFLSYSSLNYYGLSRVIAPSVIVLSPTTVAENIDLSIAGVLPNTKDGNAAKSMLLSKTKEMQRLHEAWLFHTKLHESFVLYQTIGWAIAAIISLCAVLVLHRMKRQTH